ncbi:hypothetical protein Pmani_009367 [Petrolisthes manimaculis]|uniref:Uncharacterized protein n=1 Tax=Petrolisthes manimaculis TaxID=1843537 RepID=A0AAE1Q3N5_9EUCA|nr:hypothetical protein Pmani_009367 [Petrolisthes manimaculis]
MMLALLPKRNLWNIGNTDRSSRSVVLKLRSSEPQGSVKSLQGFRENAELRFFQSYTTTTWTFLSSFTSTVPYTCYITAAAAIDNKDCVGRHIRRLRRSQLYSKLEDDEQLYDSLGEEMTQTGDHINEKERFFFTLVRTGTTTVTITTFSTNRSVTVSASAMCQFPNININYC